MSHSQRYPPGAFRHWPFSHRFTLSAHSSMSATECNVTAGEPALEEPPSEIQLSVLPEQEKPSPTKPSLQAHL